LQPIQISIEIWAMGNQTLIMLRFTCPVIRCSAHWNSNSRNIWCCVN